MTQSLRSVAHDHTQSVVSTKVSSVFFFPVPQCHPYTEESGAQILPSATNEDKMKILFIIVIVGSMFFCSNRHYDIYVFLGLDSFDLFNFY